MTSMDYNRNNNRNPQRQWDKIWELGMDYTGMTRGQLYQAMRDVYYGKPNVTKAINGMTIPMLAYLVGKVMEDHGADAIDVVENLELCR